MQLDQLTRVITNDLPLILLELFAVGERLHLQHQSLHRPVFVHEIGHRVGEILGGLLRKGLGHEGSKTPTKDASACNRPYTTSLLLEYTFGRCCAGAVI